MHTTTIATIIIITIIIHTTTIIITTIIIIITIITLTHTHRHTHTDTHTDIITTSAVRAQVPSERVSQQDIDATLVGLLGTMCDCLQRQFDLKVQWPSAAAPPQPLLRLSGPCGLVPGRGCRMSGRRCGLQPGQAGARQRASAFALARLAWTAGPTPPPPPPFLSRLLTSPPCRRRAEQVLRTASSADLATPESIPALAARCRTAPRVHVC